MEDQIKTFYKAFNDRDAETMVSCYHDEISFEDPAFGILKGERAKNMWRMLCHSQKDKDFRVNVSDIIVNNEQGSAHWEAHYFFSKTGRKVHNKIDAEFTFRDGKIYTHKDRFNLYKWASQALGIKGSLLGWTSIFQNKLQQQTRQLLNKFENNL